MHDEVRQLPGVDRVCRATRDNETRSLRAPGWLDKPGALRSLDVCLDAKSPFIDALNPLIVSLQVHSGIQRSDLLAVPVEHQSRTQEEITNPTLACLGPV